MKHALASLLAIMALGLLASPSPAHFNMLLPRPVSAQSRMAVLFLYQWGHPFEHDLFEAPTPASVLVLTPGGKKTDLTKALTRIKVRADEGKEVGAFSFDFTPEERGDHIFILHTPPIWMEVDKEFLQDTVKVVLHVQAQNGWDRVAGEADEVVPLTRPYGLQPGMVFRAQALVQGKPRAGALVEIERYNPRALKALPPDEFRTYTAKTDPTGVVACTLPEPGWWCITVHGDSSTLDHDGKPYPLRRRTSLWVFVDEKVGGEK